MPSVFPDLAHDRNHFSGALLALAADTVTDFWSEKAQEER